tara:strand:+ start:226 stop:498 length:273 start_codon:yes stop_codon:yes gene_type:complete
MEREAEVMEQAYAAMLGSVSVINSVIATHNKGSDATRDDFCFDLTHDEKKERVSRSSGYLEYQKENFSDWGSKDFSDIDAAISAANSFTS